MTLETFRTRSGEIAVKGEDFKVTIQPDGSLTLHYGDRKKYIDWIFNEREKTAKDLHPDGAR